VWNVRTTGTTAENPSITGNSLSVTGVGTVWVTATITNGLTASSNYTKDFSITMSMETGNADITLGFTDAGGGAFIRDSFTISKGGAGVQTITLIGAWTSKEWRVDNQVKGTGNSITVNAADYTIGGHVLSLRVQNGDGWWTKNITFTVTN
jgi:hypothetical protein